MNNEQKIHENNLVMAETEFERYKEDLAKVFDEKAVMEEIKRVEKHMEKIRKERKNKHEKKLPSDDAIEDLDDNGNIVDGINPAQVRVRRKRRFKRKYLQPQPKRVRKRKPKSDEHRILPEGWNGIIKNISGVPVTETEEQLFVQSSWTHQS